MFYVNVKTNADAFAKRVNRLMSKEIPFATAQALTAVAKMVVSAEQRNEEKVLDRPRPFTENAIAVAAATKASQAAIVFMKDITAAYLLPYEFGGRNKLNSRALLKPTKAIKSKLDQYGNLPRFFMRNLVGAKDAKTGKPVKHQKTGAILGRKDVFIGTIATKNGAISGVWQRDSSTDLKNMKAAGLRVSGGGYNRSGKLKLLIRFTDAHDAKQHLDWFGVAERTVRREFDRAMRRALALAMMNRK
jgi:hypothetical protein